MIYQADRLRTPGRPPLENGWLRVERGRIAEVGSGPVPAGEVRRFDGCTLMPGLINAHCHLELTALENKLTPGKVFPEWVKDLQGAAAAWSPADYHAAAQDGIRRLLRGGCTTVLDVGNSGEALRALAASPLRSFGCVEVLGLDPAQADARFEKALETMRGASPALPRDGGVPARFHPGLAPHAAYSGSKELLRKVTGHQVTHRLPVTIHAAESREEAALFASASGPLRDFCARIFPDAPVHRGTTPVRWLESEGLLPDGALIVHGNTLDEADMEILARRGATVVHCPSSHAFFGHPRFPYEKLRARGIPMCLGTDSLASGDSLSMLAQMRLFSENYPEVRQDEVLAMATTVAARALGLQGVTGELLPGHAADFIIVGPDESAETVVIDGLRV